MAIAKLFKSSVPNIFTILQTGTRVNFVNGVYFTTNKEDIAELTEEVLRGHPQIYIDANETEIDTKAVTPYEQLKQKIRGELLAEMAAASDTSNDRGTYGGSSDDNSGVDVGLVTTHQFVEGAKLNKSSIKLGATKLSAAPEVAVVASVEEKNVELEEAAEEPTTEEPT